MYFSDFHPERSLLVCRLARGGDEANDFGPHMDRFRSAAEANVGREQKLAILVVIDAGHPMPGSAWRARIAEVTGLPIFQPYLAIVSQNPLVRGVLTALSWIRPKHYDDTVVPNIREGIAWLEKMRGEPLPELVGMVDRVMREGGLPDEKAAG